MRTRRWPAVALAVGLAVGSGAAVLPATGQAAATQNKATRGKDRVVTLITGDRVVLRGGDRDQVSIERAAGRNPGHLRESAYRHAVDRDPVRRPGGRKDRATRQAALRPGPVRDGYDDAARGDIPLIVSGRPRATRQATTVRELNSTTALVVPKHAAAGFLQGQGQQAKIWLDGKREIRLDQSVPQIGAPAAWQAGYTGKGVSVAVLDTGIDTSHPDLADPGRGREELHRGVRPTTSSVTAPTSRRRSPARRRVGRQVQGCRAGRQAVRRQGVREPGCPESAILAGMEWAANEVKAKVVNLSLGGTDTPEVDPLEEAVNRLTAETGTLFVIAAGNEGSGGGHHRVRRAVPTPR